MSSFAQNFANASSTGGVLNALRNGPLRVAIVGAGNFGTVIGKLAAINCASAYIFADEVRMWVYDEDVGGRKLSEIINTDHENTKYLPGIKLPHNLIAVPDVIETVKGANLLVFVTPSQFIKSVAKTLVDANAVEPGAKAVSLMKGFYIENGMPCVYSDVIENMFGISCQVLCGANVANSVAKEEFSESTLGYSDVEMASLWQQLFDVPYFKVNAVPDKYGVEVCGAAKNVLALAYGYCDALGYGTNTKAAIIRIGFEEMRNFCLIFFNNIREDTFWDSAGIADVITTCFGGRNARCAAEFVKHGGNKSWEDLEKDMLNGQKLQGTITVKELYEVLCYHALQEKFPLMTVIYRITFDGADAKDIIGVFQTKNPRPIKTLQDTNLALLSQEFESIKCRIMPQPLTPASSSPSRQGVLRR